MDVTSDRLPLARAALRDILFLYVDMVGSYGGFGHDLDVGRFDPLEWLDSRIADPQLAPGEVDLDLLRQGAACALLCRCVDAFDDHGALVLADPALGAVEAAWRAGRFAFLPEIDEAFRTAFAGDEAAFREQLARVYRRCVLDYFGRLARG